MPRGPAANGKRPFILVEIEMMRNGYNRTDLAGAIGVSRPTMSKLLQGEVDWKLSQCYKVLQVLNMSQEKLSELFPPIAG